MPKKKIRIDLALQGGGAHGAFTWGVLERLLEDARIDIAGVSGASAGAMNAAVLAHGLATGGRAGAQRALWAFWKGVSRAATGGIVPSDLLGGFFAPWSPATWAKPFLAASKAMMSPYQFNPLNVNPLRRLLEDQIDFAALTDPAAPRLFVSATDVRSGRTRLFRNDDLSADALMASACLPMLFQAVEIGEDAYWDGGYTANPSILPLIEESPANDLMLVTVNPSRREEVPKTPGDIVGRLNEITFNTNLVSQMRSVAILRQQLELDRAPPARYSQTLFRQVEKLRVHRIHDDAQMAGKGSHSKMNTEWRFLIRLHGIGWRAADTWLAAHGGDLGKRSSLDLAATYC